MRYFYVLRKHGRDNNTNIYLFIERVNSVVGAVRPRESQRDCNRASIRRVPRYTYSDVCSGSHHT